MILGGGHLSQYSASTALGVNPGAASGTVIIDNTAGGGAFTLGVGDYIVYAFDSLAAFYGIITETGEGSSDPTGGTQYTFSVADNRIRLQWQVVYGAFNMEDETWAKRLGRPAPPSAPGDSSSHGDDGVDFASGFGTSTVEGIDAPGDPGDTSAARRRYWSILPKNWAAGIRTWHDTPWTARQILNFAFDGAWGDFGFTRNYHSALSDLILTNLDYTQGVKLASLISEINEKAGLEITITGSRTLVWYRKGSGLPPLPDSTSRDRSVGESLTSNDTKIRVIGERIRVQVANVELEPDWKTGWEPFIDEVAWRREVADVFSLPVATKSDQAELSARAREITVWQYAKEKADPALLDSRPFGRISRNSMPAWTYLQEIVFRSYRVPPTKTLYGIPISSLEMAETLICATDISGSGESTKQIYQTDPVEFYPSTQAEAIVQGQPLDLINARDIRLFYRNRTRDLRTEWSILNDFEVDSANFSIRFATPVFVDGLPSAGESLFLKLNAGEGGGTDVSAVTTEESDYLDVIVPNPGCVITAAAVKLSFTVLLAPFHRDYGTGPRRGALPVQGLGLHLLDVKGGIGGSLPGTASFANSDLTVPDPTSTGSSFREVLYEDGGNAIAKAASAAESITALSAVQASGGFKRCGTAAATVSGVVDRVTVTVSHGAGVTEDVTYTKARPTGIALAERTLARIQRGSELFPGQEALRKEVRDYRAIAAAFRGAEKGIETASRRRLADAFGRAVGSEASSTQILYDKNSAAPTRGDTTGWNAGDIVWVDGDGWPSATGRGLAGVLVATPVSTGEGEGATQTKELTVTTRGIVPVRIRGTVTAGGTVLAAPGQHYGGSTGSKTIGTLMHGEDVPVPAGTDPEVLAMVNLGGGGGEGSPAVIPPLSIVTSKPAYIPEPSALVTGYARFYLTWGLVNGVLATNWNNCLDVSLAGTSRYLFMKAMVTTSASANLRVTSCEWLTGTADDTYQTPAWPSDGSRPAYIIIPLGQILVADGVATHLSAGGGSIEINEHIAQVAPGTSGSTVYRKRFSYKRLVY